MLHVFFVGSEEIGRVVDRRCDQILDLGRVLESITPKTAIVIPICVAGPPPPWPAWLACSNVSFASLIVRSFPTFAVRGYHIQEW